MNYPAKELILKSGQHCVLRETQPQDAADLLTYLKAASQETPFLMREPEEITLTMKQELQFIKSRADSKRELILIAQVNGQHTGNCSLSSFGDFRRYTHRCSIAIALYQKTADMSRPNRR